MIMRHVRYKKPNSTAEHIEETVNESEFNDLARKKIRGEITKLQVVKRWEE